MYLKCKNASFLNQVGPYYLEKAFNISSQCQLLTYSQEFLGCDMK